MAKKKTALGANTSKATAEEIVRASLDSEPAADTASSSEGTTPTSKGYVTADGVEKRRVSIHLTKPQRQRLKELADDEGVTVSDYIVAKLNL